MNTNPRSCIITLFEFVLNSVVSYGLDFIRHVHPSQILVGKTEAYLIRAPGGLH